MERASTAHSDAGLTAHPGSFPSTSAFAWASWRRAANSAGLRRIGTDSIPVDNMPLITINYLIVLSTALLKTTTLIAHKQALDVYRL